MNAADFCNLLKEHQCDFFTGVPCTILASVIVYLAEDDSTVYIPATREEEAIGIATGACLCGKRPVVLMQNTGFGSSIGALASLVILYKIPLLFLISWRGYEGKDAPEHRIIGTSIIELLKAVKVPTLILSKENCEEVVSEAVRIIDQEQVPVAIMIKAGILDG